MAPPAVSSYTLWTEAGAVFSPAYHPAAGERGVDAVLRVIHLTAATMT